MAKKKKHVKWVNINKNNATKLLSEFKNKYILQSILMVAVVFLLEARTLMVLPELFRRMPPQEYNQAAVLITAGAIVFVPLFLLIKGVGKRIVFIIANKTQKAQIASIEEVGLTFIPNKEDSKYIHVKNSKREYKIKYLSGDASIIKNSKELNILMPSKWFPNNLYAIKSK